MAPFEYGYISVDGYPARLRVQVAGHEQDVEIGSFGELDPVLSALQTCGRDGWEMAGTTEGFRNNSPQRVFWLRRRVV